MLVFQRWTLTLLRDSESSVCATLTLFSTHMSFFRYKLRPSSHSLVAFLCLFVCTKVNNLHCERTERLVRLAVLMTV